MHAFKFDILFMLGAEVWYGALWTWIRVLKEHHQMCGKFCTNCPVMASADFHIQGRELIPITAAWGKYKIRLEAAQPEGGDVLFCLEARFNVVSSSDVDSLDYDYSEVL